MRARDSAEKAREAAENAQTHTRNLTFGAAIALVLSLTGVLAATWNLISSANKNVADASNTVRTLREDQISLQKRIEALEIELRTLRESKLLSPSSAPASAKIEKSGIQKSPKRQ
jgi:hypothetical protein